MIAAQVWDLISEKTLLNCNQYVLAAMTWEDARQYCQEQGGNLVCLETPAEAQFVYQFAAVQHGTPEVFSFWLGATSFDGQSFLWVSGSPVQFTDWASKRGKGAAGEVLKALRVAPGAAQFKWYTESGSGRRASDIMFICEWDR